MRNLLLSLLVLALISACKPKNVAQPPKVEDLGKTRIITIGSKATEIIFKLGLEKFLVARDDHSTYPKEVENYPILGKAHSFSVEGILALKPTHIVAWHYQEYDPVFVDKIKKGGVEVIALNHKPGLKPLYEDIAKVGELFDKQKQADALLKEIKQDLALAADYVQSKDKPGNGMFIFAKGMSNLWLAGKNTGAEMLMNLANIDTAIQGFEDYKPVNPEVIVKTNPQNILMVYKGVDSLGGVENVGRIKGVQSTDAFKNKNILLIHRTAFEFGPRIGQFALELAKKVQGDLPKTQRN